MLCRLTLQFGNEMDGSLVLVLCQMPIDAVVAGIDTTTDIPLPERGIGRIERFFPMFIPIQKTRVLVEAFRKFVDAKPLVDSLVGKIGLSNETCRWIIIFFFLPMYGNFSFRHINPLFHSLPPEKTRCGLARRCPAAARSIGILG